MENKESTKSSSYVNINEIKRVFSYYFNYYISVVMNFNYISNYFMENAKAFAGLKDKINLNKFIISTTEISSYLDNDYFVIKLGDKASKSDLGFASLALTLNKDRGNIIVADEACLNKSINDALYTILYSNNDFIRNSLIQAYYYRHIFHSNEHKQIRWLKNNKTSKIPLVSLENLLLVNGAEENDILICLEDLPELLHQLILQEIPLETDQEYSRIK